MNRRPRVTARHETPSYEDGPLCGPMSATPDVLIEVGFDLHDHEAALSLLARAVDDIRSQIEETKK